jgi:hypothetical protein
VTNLLRGFCATRHLRAQRCDPHRM